MPLKIQDVQIAVAAYAKAQGRQPLAVVTNQWTHDYVAKLLGKPEKPLQKWRINNALADGELGFD